MYRNLTKEERKQWKEFGEVENCDYALELFAWSEKPLKNRTEKDKTEIFNYVALFQVWENAIVQTEQGVVIALKEGYLISMINYAGTGTDFFFNVDDFDTALNRFNNLVKALEKTNYL